MKLKINVGYASAAVKLWAPQFGAYLYEVSASKWCPLVQFQQYVKNIPDDGQTIKLLTSAKLRCCLESSPLFTSYKKKIQTIFHTFKNQSYMYDK